MYNWNTDITGWDKKSESYQIWKLEQLINYGLNGDKISESDISKFWKKVKPNLDPYRARMIEYLVWRKKYSLPIKLNFWNLYPKTKN